MAFEDINSASCRNTMHSESFIDGEELGTHLSHGEIEVTAKLRDELEAKLNVVAVQDNPAIAWDMYNNFLSGVKCTDPSDLNLFDLEGGKMYVIDLPAENAVNIVRDELKQNGFNANPETLEDAIKLEIVLDAMNDQLQNPKIWNYLRPQRMKEDFVDDFNRRRNQEHFLPNIEAYIDPDGEAKLRSILLTNGKAAEK